MICSKCKQDKVHIFHRFKKEMTGKKTYIVDQFVDEHGKSWRFKTCPDCRSSARKTYYVRFETPPKGVTRRSCTKCRGPMTGDRYFTCKVCAPALPEDYAGYEVYA